MKKINWKAFHRGYLWSLIVTIYSGFVQNKWTNKDALKKTIV